MDEYIANKTVDTNGGVCSAEDCLLREAVRNANACAGWQTITIPAGAHPLAIAGADDDAASPRATMVEEGCKEAWANELPGLIVCAHSQTIMSRAAS